MKNRIISPLLAVVLAFPIVGIMGCTMGNKAIYKEDDASLSQKIVKGKTTKADLVQMFGKADGGGLKNGVEYWQYQSVKTNFVFSNSKYVSIYFDKKGVVSSFDLEKF